MDQNTEPKKITVELTLDDRNFILIALGHMVGTTVGQKDDDGRVARIGRRSLEIANKLGCTYEVPK